MQIPSVASTQVHDSLIPQAKEAESKVFYHKMKGDYYRYIAEFTEGDTKKEQERNMRGNTLEKGKLLSKQRKKTNAPCQIMLGRKRVILPP